jgi:hypothetical protein
MSVFLHEAVMSVLGRGCRGGTMKMATALLWLVAATLPATGCVPEDLGGGLDIVNQTEEPLIAFQHTIPANGGQYRLTGSRPTVVALEGSLFARRTEPCSPNSPRNGAPAKPGPSRVKMTAR